MNAPNKQTQKYTESEGRVQTVILGLQHTFVMFGSTVLVPLLTGLNVSTTLLTVGIGTLIFHALTKGLVPIFLGSSFAFIPSIVFCAKSEGMPYALGGLFLTGIVYTLVGFLTRYIKRETFKKILPTHVTGPMIVLIGLILAPVAVSNSNGTNAPQILAQIGAGGCWGIALFTIVISMFVKLALPKTRWKFLSLLPVLISLVAGYTLCLVLGVIEVQKISAAAWFGPPSLHLPKFSLTSASLMIPVALVAIVEHIGDVLAIQNVVGRDFFKNPGIHRTLMGDGVATMVSASMGGPVLTTYSENTGAVALTGKGDPSIMRVAAIFAILLSFVPKFTAIISTIPTPVIGGISILLFGMISSIGIKNMVDEQVNFQDPKILLISASMLILGLGGAQVSYGVFKLEGLGLAAVVGLVLNFILNGKSIMTRDLS